MFFSRRRAPSLSDSSDATSSPSSPYVEDDDTSSFSLSSVDEMDHHARVRERRRREQLQQEWEEGLAQLQLIFVVVLMPWLGKYWGRKWAHTLHARYLRVGLGKTFFYL
ncbi:hypothetical protein M408DRAFT_187739 [Serendipita vermifera MAFF 305830]|uniref:Uncharacterized protein n=1 Tax=Serendipita vermifera MAFF 305830 TaxID=933852 RepID=A0A0C3BN30_SERVB|nr:hypothetical protein M408DRAFT_187739 [Serendipita vermifera MAFF 305830]